MKRYSVTAAYVTARVPDVAGGWVLKGFHGGGWLPADTHPDDIVKLLRKTMIAEVGAPEPKAEPAEEPKPEPKPTKSTAK